MNERIELIEKKNILEFNFLNGSIKLDKSRYGAYALCPGCGAGKTTIIKQLIGLKWHEGVLYSAFTKNEVNEMYNWIINNLVGRSINPTNGQVLTVKDILVLHSDYSSDGTDKDLWLNHPELIADKKVVLCTHSKLLNEPLDILFNSNFNPSLSDLIGPIDASIRGCGGDGSLPRQWILIDESTEAKPIRFKITKSMLAAVGDISDQMTQTTFRNSIGEIEYGPKTYTPRIVKKSEYYKVFNMLLDCVYNFTPGTFLGQLKTEKTALDKVRNEQFRRTLFHKFDEAVDSKVDPITVNFSFTDLINPSMLTRFILFDGTSDITLSSSKKINVLSYENKYNSKVNLNLFSFYGLARNIKSDKSIPDLEFYIEDKINSIVDSLEDIVKKNNKTLIFTWMDLKSNSSEINDDEYINSESGFVTEAKTAVVNPNFLFYKYIQHKLEERGLRSGENFSIEYYGGGKDKAVNEYREYDSVVLAGNYRVPNSVINEFNMMFGSNVTGSEYYCNRAIQAICRTRIRNHKGESVNVYISSDWSGDTINSIRRYLGIDKMNSQVKTNSSIELDYMYTELRKMRISPKKAEQIAKLSLLDPNIFNAIVNRSVYNIEIKLNDIFNIIPMTEKKMSRYDKLKTWIKTYGINLRII